MSSAEEITAELRRRLPKRSEADQIIADILESGGLCYAPYERARAYMERVRDREHAEIDSRGAE
jgi:hypothetical protein